MPITATTILGLKYFFSSFKSLSKPAININMTTPNSANDEINCVGLTIFKIAGPIRTPASSCPTTEGSFIFVNIFPMITEDNKIMEMVKI